MKNSKINLIEVLQGDAPVDISYRLLAGEVIVFISPSNPDEVCFCSPAKPSNPLEYPVYYAKQVPGYEGDAREYFEEARVRTLNSIGFANGLDEPQRDAQGNYILPNGARLLPGVQMHTMSGDDLVRAGVPKEMFSSFGGAEDLN